MCVCGWLFYATEAHAGNCCASETSYLGSANVGLNAGYARKAGTETTKITIA